MSAEVVEARYDPSVVTAALRRNSRAMLVAAGIYVVSVLWVSLDAASPNPPEMPLAVIILTWTAVLALVVGYLAFVRWGVTRQVSGDERDGSVTALAVSLSGLRLPFGHELPWRAITSLHLVDISGRAAGFTARGLGARAGKQLSSALGVGTRTLVVVLNDGPGFAASIPRRVNRRRITLFDRKNGSTGGHLTVSLEPLAPRAEVDAVLDVLEAAAREHGIPFARDLQYRRTAVAIPSEARVP